jgi:hypothetical protein
MDFGTMNTMSKFYDMRNKMLTENNDVNRKDFSKIYLQLLSDIKGEYKRKTITKDEYYNLLKKYHDDFVSA